MKRNGKIAAILILLLLYFVCSMEIETGDYLQLFREYDFLVPGLLYGRLIGGMVSLFSAGFLLARLRSACGASGAVRVVSAVLMAVLLAPVICLCLYLLGFLTSWPLTSFVLRNARLAMRFAPLISLPAGFCLGLTVPKREDD